MQAPGKMSPLEPPFGGSSLTLPLSALAPGAEEPRASFPHFPSRPLLISLHERFCPKPSCGHIWVYAPENIYKDVCMHIYTCACICERVEMCVNMHMCV